MRTSIVFAMTLVPSAALAGGYIIPQETARELGLAQSAVADQTGAESVLLNPASLADQDGLDISASGELLINRTDWSAPDLGSSSLITKPNAPPSAAVSYSQLVKGSETRWGVGVGFDVPAGGSLEWPTGWPGQEYIQSVDQKVYRISAGAALELLPYISFGATYVRYQGTEQLHQEINYIDHYGDASLGMSGGADTFSLGGLFHVPTTRLSLGAYYAYKASATITGHVHFADVPPSFQSMLYDQGVTESLTMPSVLHAGAAYDIIPQHLTVMATFDWEGWSVYHEDKFVGSGGLTILVPRNYSDAEVYRVGAEWSHVPFAAPLTLRVGALRSVSQQPADTVSPTLTDGDSWAFSLGAGVDVTHDVRIDVGWEHAFFDNVTAGGTETLPGTYKTMVDLVSLGLNWRIDLAGCSNCSK
ncbi:MAG TPA: outer membrane protein transport protein [Kofleriaceae bacterium]|nr:outer membrane protein transport protein [Kofleriaceae bacterium]